MSSIVSENSCPLCESTGDHFYQDKRRQAAYYQCQQCALVWLDPKSHLSPSEEKKHYDTHENDPEDQGYRNFLSKLWDPLKEELRGGSTGLDYGSGPGPTLHLMAQADGFDCTHYDPFFHPDESVFNKQYDFITCSETAEHFHRPAAEFEKLTKLLRPEGWLAVMSSRIDKIDDFENWRYRLDHTHVCFYSKASFEWIAQRFEFSKVVFPSESVVLLQR